jgi:hypothetical protein
MDLHPLGIAPIELRGLAMYRPIALATRLVEPPGRLH